MDLDIDDEYYYTNSTEYKTKTANEEGGKDQMRLNSIRRIIQDENLKKGFIPVKHFYLTRGDTAHLLFGIYRLLKLDILKRHLTILTGWEAISP